MFLSLIVIDESIYPANPPTPNYNLSKNSPRLLPFIYSTCVNYLFIDLVDIPIDFSIFVLDLSYFVRTIVVVDKGGNYLFFLFVPSS